MRNSKRYLSSTASLLILGCSGSAAWEDSCGCAPAWVGLASELHNPQPWTADMVEPAAVSTAVWKYLNAQPRPATLDAVRSMSETFRSACIKDAAVIRCTVWLWYRKGGQRGLQVQVPFDEKATHLAPTSVTTAVVFKET